MADKKQWSQTKTPMWATATQPVGIQMAQIEDVGKLLRKLRTAKGMSLTDVSKLTGMTPGTISISETQNSWDAEKLLTLSKIYGVNISLMFSINLDDINRIMQNNV